MSTPGIADPYYYEWYVGLKKVIEMLNPDSEIAYVIFQHGKYNTIDDVVVEYANSKEQRCYQVKHQIATSAPDNLTFGKILEAKGSSKEKTCLFEAMYQGWQEAKGTSAYPITPVLYTNRKILNRRTSRTVKGTKYRAYSLDTFIAQMKIIIASAEDSGRLEIDDPDIAHQWDELCTKLPNVKTNDLIDFLKVWTLECGQISLTEMKETLIHDLGKCFSCSDGVAQELFSKLLLGLTEWTTSQRKDERVTKEDVYSVLGVEADADESQHRLAPPFPFFESRKAFCVDLKNKIQSTNHKVVFVSGDPGSGKTSTISFVQAQYNLFTLRYHTFRPISPEQHFYNTDPGMCTPENLWGTLLTQLRKKFRGRLAECEVPVSNKLISIEDMRKNVLRLLRITTEESKPKKVIVCIDGIDHAARSSISVSFLDTLPKPEEIPNRVCFVIVGQPTSIYQNEYPIWLTTGDNIERIDMPKLCSEDIKQLVLQNVQQFEANAEGLANLIFKQTEGNNLSAVFAVEELKKQKDLESAIAKLQNSGIGTDIQQYYNHIWNHMKTVLLDSIHTPVYPESVVACPLLLMNGRVSTRILAKAIQNGLSETDWQMILDGLHPLIISTDSEGEYALFHNDFRVFLMSIIQRYQARYEETALQLAEYLLKNDEGLLTYVQGIPLLNCAKKENLIPKYFTVGFVINALAEGISKERLDEFVHMAYKAACDNHDIQGYQNVYLAVKTLHQHCRYYEYYDRAYEVRDYPEIGSIDISEIRTLPLSKENIDEYERVLLLCRKLYISEIQGNVSRALGLYDRWFGKITIADIVSLSADSVNVEEYWKIKTTEIGFLLQSWGRTAAELKIIPPENKTASSKIDFYAKLLWGEEYFKTSIEKEQYEFAVISLKKGYVSETAFVEMLDEIYYKGVTGQFQSALPHVSPNQENISKKLLALAMNVVYDDDYLPEVTDLLQVTSIKHVYDESSFTIVLYGFLIGRIHREDEEDTLLLRIDERCNGIESSENEKDQLVCMARTACLLGRCFRCSGTISIRFEGYIEWFLTAKLVRSFDYLKANHFLLYTLLNSPVGERFATCDWFISALRTNLFNINQLGMYYKADILEYLQRLNRLDVVEEYIFELYGEDCSKISLADDRKSMHQRFSSYGKLVAPELMDQFSQKLKWDVVGYMDYKEYAMHAPADLFKSISETHPERWRDLGNILFYQSKIANLWGNHAHYEICEMIIEAAVKCGLDEYWRLRFVDNSFQRDPQQIYQALFTFIDKANSLDELKAIWILNCGIHSWYTQSERIGSECIFKACNRRSKEISVDFVGAVEQITPQWATIMNHQANQLPGVDTYASHREEEIETLRAKYSILSDDEVINSIELVNKKSNPADHYVVILDRIRSIKLHKENAISQLLNAVGNYLSSRDWTHSGLEPVISSLIEIVGDNAFWTFACCIEKELSDYDYQTSSRNMQLLVKVLSYSKNSIQQLFEDEIATQKLWVTGNNHISVSVENETISTVFSKPRTIQELSLYIILEQIDSQNARKLEIAMFSMYLLGKEFPELMDMLPEIWNILSQIQQETLLLVVARWASDGICSQKLSHHLKTLYLQSANLYTKYLLHSILYRLSDPDVSLQKISCDAKATSYVLPKTGKADCKSCYENFLLMLERYENQSVSNAIRRIICENSELVRYHDDEFACDGDSRIPVISRIPCEVLYGEEKARKWDDIPIIIRKSSLLASEDPFVLTEMPEVVFDQEWFPDVKYNYDESQKNGLDNDKLSSIVRYGITDENILLAASLWYPWGYKEGTIYTEISKLDADFCAPNYKSVDWSLGSYGLLANEGALNETQNTTIGYGGHSLFNRIGGISCIPLGNVQVVPSSIWRTVFNCAPKSNNPFIWVDMYGKEVMWFERITSPTREVIREAYIRQPILFRWVCDKRWMDLVLQQYDVKLYWQRIVEPYIS